MTQIHVLAPGLLTTVQDLGRPGFGPMGVSASGAADAVSLRVGNLLVGNAEGAAAFEMTLLGGTFVFPHGGAVALTGSDFGATLDDAPVPLWTSFKVNAGQTMRVGPTRSGARCYLCVRGGIVVQKFLGSASTHLLSGLGGHEGRALRKGDVLEIGSGTSHSINALCQGTASAVPKSAEKSGVLTPEVDPKVGRAIYEIGSNAFRRREVSARALERLAPRKVLRVTDGPQSEWFSEDAKRKFYSSSYRVAEESNRMGIRLEGGTIAGNALGEMLSEGVSLGAIQVPESGRPIILFVEQQTTGGYPKIANVISADFHSLGQLRPRDEIRFERVSLETALSLLFEQEKLLAAEELLFERF